MCLVPGILIHKQILPVLLLPFRAKGLHQEGAVRGQTERADIPAHWFCENKTKTRGSDDRRTDDRPSATVGLTVVVASWVWILG